MWYKSIGLIVAVALFAGCATTQHLDKQRFVGLAGNEKSIIKIQNLPTGKLGYKYTPGSVINDIVAHFFCYIQPNDHESNLLKINVKFVNNGDFPIKTNALFDRAFVTLKNGKKYNFDIGQNPRLYSGVVVSPGQSDIAVLKNLKVPMDLRLKNIQKVSVFLAESKLWFNGVFLPENLNTSAKM